MIWKSLAVESDWEERIDSFESFLNDAAVGRKAYEAKTVSRARCVGA